MTVAFASAVTVIVPIPSVNGLAVKAILALPTIVKVPIPKVNGFATKSSVIESAMIPTLPMKVLIGLLI